MVNYGNGNARSPETKKAALQGFGAAIATSTSIVLGARALFSRRFSGLQGGKLLLANTLLNAFAVGTANATNVIVMRRHEFKEGIPVTSRCGTVNYGKSAAAGEKAVLETCASRMFLPIPGMVLPAALFMYMTRRRLWPKSGPASLLLKLSFAFSSFGLLALPMATGLFKPK